MTALIGRQAELDQIDELLSSGRSVTILGTGGMGKTQCAIAYAHSRAATFADGVWFFDLASLRRAEDWLQMLALSLAIAPDGELLGKIAENLSDRRALLFLDNCDRLSLEIGELVVELLRRTQHLKVLATSQQQLRFVSERILRMPPLALPTIKHAADDTELRQIGAAPAVRLLLERIQGVQSEFRLDLANSAAIVAICERLDGMPLALELAAVRFALLSPEQVLDRLEHRFRFLVGDAAGRDRRHRNLIALLEWGYALLSPDEQRLLAWLSTFVQGWTVGAVIDLAPAFGASPELAVDLLTGLANKSLTTVDHSVTPPRYRLLESVRAFALEQLAGLGDETRARNAHLAFVLRMTQVARESLLGSHMRRGIALLMAERGNIDAASEYAVGAGDAAQAAIQIAGNLMLYVKAHGDFSFGCRLCDRAFARGPHPVSRELALTHLSRGVINFYTAKDVSDPHLHEAARLARQMRDVWTEAYASSYLALLMIHVGRLPEAAEHAALAATLAREASDDMLVGLAGLARGWLNLARENVGEALADLRAVRDLGFESHQHHFIGMYVGLSLFQLGDFAAAAREWLEALRNANSVGHLRGAAGSVEGCAYIAERFGHDEDACRLLGAAEQIRERNASGLFCFWYPHNEQARAALRTRLGGTCYEAAALAGARMHSEDAINEAARLLRQFGES